MNRKIFTLISLLILCSFLFSQETLKEFEVEIKRLERGVSAEPNTAKLIVKSKIPGLTFDSNMGLKRVEKLCEGEWKITLYPGNQRFEIKAKGFLSYSERHTFDKGRVYECFVKEKVEFIGERIDEKLFEVTFEFNVPDVYCSYGKFAPIKTKGRIATFKLPKGEYTFHFEKDGYSSVSTTLKIERDQIHKIKLTKDESTKIEFRPPGIIAVNTDPMGAEVIINGQKIGSTPIPGYSLTAGEHQMVIRKSMYYPEFITFSLKEGEAKQISKVLRPKFGYLSVVSHPDSAEIFIDGISYGKTPLTDVKVPSGKHLLTANLNLYHKYSMEFEITDEEKKQIEFELSPAFGTIEIHTIPEEGATVYINGKEAGKTPFINKKFPSGRYTIEIKKKYFFPASEEIEVMDGKKTIRNIILSPSVGTLIVNTSNNADIYIDGEYVGKGSIKKFLEPGNHNVKAIKDKYYPDEKDLYIALGETKEINFDLVPRQGAVSVIVEPPEAMNAEIYVNGKYVEKAPAILTLLIGEYDIEARCKGFIPAKKKAKVKENETTEVRFKLLTYEGSLQQKKDRWKRRKYISLASSVVFTAIGTYCWYKADEFYRIYQRSATPHYAKKYRNYAQITYTVSQISFGLSIGSLLGSLYSYWEKINVKINK